MSIIWVAIAVICALIAIIAEMGMGIRQNRVRQILDQPLDRLGKEKQRFYQMLFVTVLLALLLALAAAGSYRQWVQPMQGVAVVLDTESLAVEADPSRLLSIEKGAVTDLIRNIPGVTLSLYEIRGGVLHLVVPPTIDPLFFELQLDGLKTSPSAVSGHTLSEIQASITHWFPGIPPWVVLVSPVEVRSGNEDLDGAAAIEVQGASVTCTIHEVGLTFKELTVSDAAIKIGQRLTRSTAPTPPDSTVKLMLAACTGLAFICFVIWRRVNTPLFMLGLAVFACSSAFSLSDVEVNNLIQDAANLADAKDFEASQKLIESLLTKVSSSLARQRLLYDRALLSYLQGKDKDALLWLDMESSETIANEGSQAQILRGLILIRSVEKSSDDEERSRFKDLLRTWLGSHPEVPKDLQDQALITLLSPTVHRSEVELVLDTLRWLEESAQGMKAKEAGPLVSSAARLTQQMNGAVEQQLTKQWPKTIVSQFLADMGRKENSISAFRIWYDFACSPTSDEAVEFLLDQASMSAEIALNFQQQADLAHNDLALVLSILKNCAASLPEVHQQLLQWLLAKPAGIGDQQAATWYARAALWPAMLNYDTQQLKPIALMLCHEVDAQTSILARKSLCQLIASFISFSGRTESDKDPLPGLLQSILSMWYAQDPEDALDAVIRFTDKDPAQWAPRLFTLIMPYMQQAGASDQSIASLMARGVGNSETELDPVLTGRLWQVAISSADAPQEVARDIDHLHALFSELSSRLLQPTDADLRSLVLIFSIQPMVFDQLKEAQIFRDNEKKREIYDQLLQEWDTLCDTVGQRIADPTTFRLPKVKQEVESAIHVLARLRRLFSESETIPEAAEKPEAMASGQSGISSIRGKDAIRLFQEMDRADRELYGE
jgi:hypothetical protein